MTNANEIFTKYIHDVYNGSDAFELYADVVMTDWFIQLLTKMGNPFSADFMTDVWNCLDTIPYEYFDLDDWDAEIVLDNYFQAYFSNTLPKTLHAIENGY